MIKKILKKIQQCGGIPMLLFYCGLFFFSPSYTQNKVHSSQYDSFSAIRASFLNPDKEYQTAPLWVWNTRVTTGLIDSMLQEFKANAFGGVFIHPRPGLITEYLGKDWLLLYQHTVQKAAALDMNVWIYDESSYPSGFAGGLVPDQMPESYNQGQMLQLFRCDTIPASADSFFICLKKNGAQFSDITHSRDRYRHTKGDYYLFRKLAYAKQAGMVGPPDYPLVDLMVKGVTEKFIDITFSGYKKYLGNAFGNTVPGIFSDEPGIPTHGSQTTRWTPDLFGSFKEKWGYDLVPQLPCLFEETGDWKKVRHNYLETLLQLFIDRWSKPMHSFTQKNHLKWTGHYWEHGWPDAGEGPDNMAMYAWHDQPGIDMLFNQFNETSPNAQFGNIRSVKELASVANQLGKQRTLCETYGGAGWDMTFKDMKRLGDWEYALGVNFMNQHLSWMSMVGARKYDYPTTFSYQNSWWPYYKLLNEYFARLSYALSRGVQKNHVLIIEPATTAWMYQTHNQKNSRFYDIGNRFQAFLTRLEKAQAEYDLGSENIIRDHGTVEHHLFRIGAASYHTVVIPPGMENINRQTLLLLKKFVANGGKLILFEKIERCDGQLINLSDSLSVAHQGMRYPAELTDAVIKDIFLPVDLKITLNTPAPQNGSLYHHRRMVSGGQLLFLSNANLTQYAGGKVTVKGKKQVLMMNAETGAISGYPRSGNGEYTLFDFNVPPAGSALFFIADRAQKVTGNYQPVINKTELTGSTVKVERPRENTMMIDFCDVQIHGKEKKGLHVKAATQWVFTENGFSGDPWDHQMQFRTGFVQRDTFSAGSGFTVSYHFSINNGVNAKNFRAVIEQGHLWSAIRINGHKIMPGSNWWLDRAFTVLEVGPYLRDGINTLSLTIDPMSIYAAIGPLFLLGDYNLESAAKGWKIASPESMGTGSWRKQGLPMYGHSIIYKKEYTLTTTGGRYFIQVDSLKASLAAVKVNGQQAGIIYAEPYMIDVSKFMKKGNNNIEIKVVGSLRNLLGPHYNAYRQGYTGPDSWNNVAAWPPGKQYHLFDYGLDEMHLYQAQ
ncbi:glycosyl hydrolase [Niabella ginsenosidivorans]|uniref:glycosyl hydrolase n=1 Tax=Niabella ginsenosidivorans TaxID=1176587 RepID=UPI000A04030D|nr:glycosyl hydrolase [Niabella ginsenosidivorans]